jgi:hypothetical protein
MSTTEIKQAAIKAIHQESPGDELIAAVEILLRLNGTNLNRVAQSLGISRVYVWDILRGARNAPDYLERIKSAVLS